MINKWVSVLLCGILLLTSLCFVPSVRISAAENVLPADAVIVIPQTPTAQESAAADRLADLIDRVTGVLPAVITDSEPIGAYEIAVGNTNRFAANLSGQPDGSYVIKSYPGGCAIVGAGMRGNIYGVYGFIREFADAKFFTKAGLTTSRNTVLLPENADLSYIPVFEYTQTDWDSPRDPEYALANGQNGNRWHGFSPALGGTTGYIHYFCHSLINEYGKPSKYFDAHPEYYALHEGKRTPEQLCLTNEGTFTMVRDEVLESISRYYNSEITIQILDLSQSDNSNFYAYCECPSCKALDEANGSHAGSLITFVNRIADAVKEAGYDDIMIETIAYSYTRTAPTNVIPRDNVIVRLCPIESCYSHTLDDPSCETNAAVLQNLKNWSAICKHLYVYDYANNFIHSLGLFPNFGTLQRNMQVFAENGVTGVYESGNYYIDACDTEFGELRAYLVSRLLRDPYCDYEAEMRDFCAAYYGPGGTYITEFLHRITENAANRHVHIWETMPDTFVFSAQEVQQLDALWSSAKAAAQTEEQLAHINRSELSWRFWKASVNAGEFAGTFEGKTARVQLHDDLIAAGTTMYNEAYTISFNENYMYYPATEWFRTDVLPIPSTEPTTQPSTEPPNGGASLNFWQRIVNWFRNLFAVIAGWFGR